MPSRRQMLAAMALGAPAAMLRAGEGQVWRVAPGDSLAAVLRRARDGDTVELLVGTHRAQAGVIEQRRLLVRGRGGPVLLQADGAHAEGKALLVVRHGDVHIEGLTFRGVRVRDGNGAAIRFESGRLSLLDCGFFDNEMGLLTGNDGLSELHVERCRFGDAPAVAAGAGFTHLLYAGSIARLNLSHSRFQAGRHGHLVKSRAAANAITANWLGSADAGGGAASYELEFPNGGLAQVQGNVIVQGAASGNRTLLSYGAEGDGATPRPHRLDVVGNSFVNLGGAAGSAIRLHGDRLGSAVPIHAKDNLYLGRLQVAAPFDDPGAGNVQAALADADVALGRFTLRGRGTPPGAHPS